MLTLPIVAGRRYVRRDGRTVEAQKGPGQCMYVGKGLQGMDPNEYVYRDSGRVYTGDNPASCDLVADEASAATGIEAQVCQDIAARQALGVSKYGTTVADNPLTHKQWLQHAYEEALDMAIYLKRAMAEIDAPNNSKV